MRAKHKLALKLNPAKSEAKGTLLSGFVWALTIVAVFERSFSARETKKEPLVHE